VQTTDQGFDYNGESDLDLEYAMALVNPQTVTLLQTGDLVEGAGFDNWLDAVDGSFCTFEGGDDPNQVSYYYEFDWVGSGVLSFCRMASILTPMLVDTRVRLSAFCSNVLADSSS